MTDGRFATVGEEELNKILLEKDSINTRRNTASAFKLFKSYLNTKICNDTFENMDVVTLNSQLTKCYVEVRQENGEKYKKSRLIAIRKIIVNLKKILWYLFYFYYDFCHHCYNNIYYFVEFSVEKFDTFFII